MIEDKDLDNLDEHIRKFTDALSKEGKVAIVAYTIEDDKGALQSNMITTAVPQSMYFHALADWNKMIADHCCGGDDEEIEPKKPWQ